MWNLKAYQIPYISSPSNVNLGGGEFRSSGETKLSIWVELLIEILKF